MVFQATPVPATGRHPIIPRTTITFGLITCIAYPLPRSSIYYPPSIQGPQHGPRGCLGGRLEYCRHQPPESQKKASRSLQPGIVQELAEHFLCRKILVGDVVGRLAVQRVVPVNFLGALNCLLERRETIDPSSSRQKSADAGLLHQHRPSSGQIAGATVAEPPTLRLDISWLSQAKLCPPCLNVWTIG